MRPFSEKVGYYFFFCNWKCLVFSLILQKIKLNDLCHGHQNSLKFSVANFCNIRYVKKKDFSFENYIFFLLHFMADTSVATAKRKSINEQKQVKRDSERHESTLGWRELQNLKRLKNLRHIFTLYWLLQNMMHCFKQYEFTLVVITKTTLANDSRM